MACIFHERVTPRDPWKIRGSTTGIPSVLGDTGGTQLGNTAGKHDKEASEKCEIEMLATRLHVIYEKWEFTLFDGFF